MEKPKISIIEDKKAAPPNVAERLTVDQPEDFEGIEERRWPRIIPRLCDTQRWERWFDNLVPAIVAATTITLISLLI